MRVYTMFANNGKLEVLEVTPACVYNTCKLEVEVEPMHECQQHLRKKS